jgi:release factor glutamine methyltransferase
VWLIAHDTDELSLQAVSRFLELEAQRLSGVPMAYIVGCREFMGHNFHVAPAVLIPRPDTEALVGQALAVLESMPAPRVVDLGTGSGAIAVSISLARPDAHVIATDVSYQALDIARRNNAALGAKVEFLQGNWYDGLPDDERFDLIVSNPPYIAAGDRHLGQGDVRFEPEVALSDGADGLSALRVIIQGAPERLKPQGALFMEHGWDQAQAVRQLLKTAGFNRIQSLPDLARIDRVSGGFYN